MSVRKLNIRPDTGVYGTYKRVSYEPWTALAEFVDNSTQSYYDHKEALEETKYWNGLEIQINYYEDSVNGDRIVIIDNAYGMNYSDFKRAIILDRPPLDTSGRNEFGMGLKTAACWFGNKWTVESTELNSNVKYKAVVDVEMLVKYKNEEIDVTEEHANRKEHYTIITIENLNRKIKGKRIERKVKELLSSIYRVDLRSGDIKIFYNGIQLMFEEVQPYVDEDNKEWKKEVDFIIPHEGTELRVKGFIGIRIPGSPTNAGLTLVRRGRVIVGGPNKNYRPYEIFGASNSYCYQRIFGELHMDNWPVTQAKDAFDWSNDDLESKFIEKLKELSAELRKKADEIRVREKVSSSDIANSLSKSFKPNESFTDVNIKLSDENTESTESLVQEEKDVFPEYEEPDLSESVGVGVDIEDNKPIDINFIHNGKSYCFNVVLDDSSEMNNWFKCSVLSEEEGKYRLTINSLFPFFEPYIQKKDFLIILIKFCIALILAELETPANAGSSAIRMKMGQILEEFPSDRKR
ncbi:MAG: ATP-binding protein [Bacilli bacterium]|jgi:hypothetical protein